MHHNKEARIAELKALSRLELEKIAGRLGLRIKASESNLSISRRVEAREFSDLRAANKRPHIREIF